MAKFKQVVKRMSLDFLGEDWKDAYIDFTAIKVSDLKEQFPDISNIDPNSPKDLEGGFELIMSILTDKFVAGKAPDESGTLVDLTTKDFEELPGEVVGRAFRFLSTGIAPS